ncbi:MAG TPA: carbon-nitrogen hydrolase family protein [Candidatus Aphodousia faecigallinarum]|uniref:Carbon-nitrogen hydrolase family protein n=1 Tax=Candidatus Aphodousia faecigallinarum TaxID=2840677 RepID=A0A9D1LE84_9BURK|nr:carbon-nitrogen hydrolase family protein [Candidatus Aphodousia faecigallinarum]
MRIAACQMVSGMSIENNVRTARALIASAAQSGAELVLLPEYFALMPQDGQGLLEMAEEFGNGPVQQAMSEAAKEAQIWLIAGTIPLKSDDDKHFIDACIVYNPNGEVAARYDKIHLFQFERGQERYHEDQITQAGKEVRSVNIETWEGVWKVGLSVCFDLRFPELFRKLDTPDIITLPAAFTTFTGRTHWDTLVRARAIENQCYVLACAQGGEHESGRQTWGHTMLIDPWGTTVAELSQGEGVLLAEVYENRIKQAREILPAFKSRAL